MWNLCSRAHWSMVPRRDLDRRFLRQHAQWWRPVHQPIAQHSAAIHHGQGDLELVKEFGARFRHVVQGAVVRHSGAGTLWPRAAELVSGWTLELGHFVIPNMKNFN